MSNPTLGKVLTDANAVPGDAASVISVSPAGTSSGVLQEPPGAGPAGTVTGIGVGNPATLNVKSVAREMPAPATLQI